MTIFALSFFGKIEGSLKTKNTNDEKFYRRIKLERDGARFDTGFRGTVEK
jgi:hypothetical protein